MKKFFLVSLVLAFFGIAANAQPAGLVGTWKSTTMDVLSDGEVIMSMNCEKTGLSMEFKFKSDNTVTGVIISEGEREEQHTRNLLFREVQIIPCVATKLPHRL